MSSYPKRPLGGALYEDAELVTLDSDASYPITGIYSFGRGLIKRPTILGSETSYERMSRLKSGQVIMSKLNAWEGALSVVNEDFGSTYASPEYPVFSIDEAVADPTYIKHLLSWPELWSSLTPRGSMVRRKRTTPATFLTTEVPLPDLAEQRRIAGKLDATADRISRITTLREWTNQVGQQYVDSQFRSPEEQAPFSAALRQINYSTEVDQNSIYPITGIYSFGKGLIKRPVIRGSETAYKRLTRLHIGQVVMSKLNAWEGALAVVGSSFDGTYVSPEYPVFNIDSETADPVYIRHLLAWPRLWSSLTPRGSMVRRKRTTPSALLTTEVPFPNLGQQRRIARRINFVYEANEAGRQQSSEVTALRSALLNAAFSGQL